MSGKRKLRDGAFEEMHEWANKLERERLSSLADTAGYLHDSKPSPMPKIPPHMLRKIKVMKRKKWVMKQLERLPFFR